MCVNRICRVLDGVVASWQGSEAKDPEIIYFSPRLKGFTEKKNRSIVRKSHFYVFDTKKRRLLLKFSNAYAFLGIPIQYTELCLDLLAWKNSKYIGS